MSESLMVMADGVRMGTVSRDGKRLGFQYDSGWLELERRYPLSLSMPLALKDHPHSAIEPFLWGLLPDNPRILEEWGRRFQVSPRNAIRIISHVGEDCAGAVQFLRDECGHQEATGPRQSRVNWINDQELSRRLTLLLENHGSTRLAGDGGQFSLAGAQPKLALHRHPATGACRWETRRPPTSSNPPPENSAGTRKTSISACASRRPSG